jgi:hypothetical protein
MEPTTFDREMACNRKAYEELKEQIRRDYTGRYVAMAFGRIVAVRPTLDEAKAALDALQPAPGHALVFAAEEEPAFEVVDAFHTEWS